MIILLLGKNGQVGWELQRALTPLGEIIALDRKLITKGEAENLKGDLNDLDALEKTILAIKPDVIVNAAAYTAVDKAESEPDLAAQINVQAPKRLAILCKQINALLVHYSTDYVFDGSGFGARIETDEVGPLSVYGQTKLNGEEAIQNSGCNHLIFRTSWVYSSKGKNFARSMLKLAVQKEQLKVINDQIGAPTSAELIADVTSHAIKKAMLNKTLNGIYHLTASGETSWYEYSCYVIKVAREIGVRLKVSEICEISTSEYPTPAKRPLNSRLNCDKLCANFDLYLPSWKDGVKRMLEETQG